MSSSTPRITNDAILAALRAAAAEIGHTPLAKDWRSLGHAPRYATIHLRFGSWDAAIAAAGLPAIEAAGPGWQHAGRRTYWTDARVSEALKLFAKVHGRVPPDDEYNLLKSGDLRFPTEQRVRDFGGGDWSLALKRAGLPYSRGWEAWTGDEDDLLMELAGARSLKVIGARLHRSYAACRRRLYDLGCRARDAGGYLTGQQCAKEYNVPVHRVLDLVRTGKLKARKGPGGVYWQIDPESAANCPELLQPKGTHKTVAPDFGDYRKRYGLRRPAKREQKAIQLTRWQEAAG